MSGIILPKQRVALMRFSERAQAQRKRNKKRNEAAAPYGNKAGRDGGGCPSLSPPPTCHPFSVSRPPAGRESRLPARLPSTEKAAFSGAPARPAQDRIRVGARGLEPDSGRDSTRSPPTRRSKPLPRRIQAPGPTLRFSLGRDRQAELSLRYAPFELSLVKGQ